MRLTLILDGLALAIALAVLAIYEPLTGALDHLRWTLLAGLGVVAVLRLALTPAAATPRRMVFTAADFAAIALALWMLASIAWAPDRAQAAVSGLRVALGLMLFMCFRRWPVKEEAVGLAAIIGVGVLAVLALLHGDPAFGGYGNPNFLAEAMLATAALCVGFALRGPAWLRALAFAAVAVALVMTLGFNRGRLAVALWGVMAAGLVWRGLPLRLPGRTALAILGLAALVAGILVAGDKLLADQSAAIRISLALNTGTAWADTPILGRGLASFGYVYPRFQEAYIHLFHMDALAATVQGSTTAGAAHNEYLQLGLETGIVGVALLGVLVVTAMMSGLRRPLTGLTGGALLVVLVLLADALAQFPLQKPATLMLGLFALARLAAEQKPRAHMKVDSYALRMGTALFVVLGLFITGVNAREYQAMRHYNQFRAQAARGQLFLAVAEEVKAFDLFPFSAEIRVRLFPATSRLYLTMWQNISQVFKYYDWVGLPALTRHREAFSLSASPDMPELHTLWIQTLAVNRYAFETAHQWPEKRQEIEGLLSRLKLYTPNEPQVWISEAYYHLMDGDKPAALAALDQAETLPGLSDADRLAIEELRHQVNPPQAAQPDAGVSLQEMLGERVKVLGGDATAAPLSPVAPAALSDVAPAELSPAEPVSP